jgi:hypothetical protein
MKVEVEVKQKRLSQLLPASSFFYLAVSARYSNHIAAKAQQKLGGGKRLRLRLRLVKVEVEVEVEYG